MLNPKNQWPDSDTALSVKFIAQTMFELLDPQQNPSFRVKTLDLLEVLYEVMRVCEDVQEAGVDQRVAESVIQECVTTLRNDIIVSKSYAFEINAFEKICQDLGSKKRSLSDIVHHASYFVAKLGDIYKDDLKEFIVEHYNIRTDRHKLRIAISSYLSHLINQGYSRSYLLNRVQEKFFKSDLGKVEKRTISKFLSEFTCDEKQYVVWALAPKAAGNFVRKLGDEWPTVQNVQSAPADVRAWIDNLNESLGENPKVISMAVEAHDPYSAVRLFNERMESTHALTSLVQPHVIIRWSLRAYVRTPRARSGASVSRFQSMFREFKLDSAGVTSNKVRNQARKIVNNFDEDSTDRILNSLSYGQIAKNSLNGENAIISIWSSFEILIRNPPRGSVRINHYKSAIVPVLCLKYVRRILNYVYSYCRLQDREFLEGCVENVESDYDNNLLKFALLLIAEDQDENQNALFANAAPNPLLQYHLWSFRDRFLNPVEYRRNLCAHEDRVNWQIERIYRARNQIVHAGYAEAYLESLARHANEYFRATIGPLVSRSRFQSDENVDDVLAQFSIEYGALKARLSDLTKVKRFARDDVNYFFV
ncbi:hypothetical protein [Alteriqipengyuania sp. 357]